MNNVLFVGMDSSIKLFIRPTYVYYIYDDLSNKRSITPIHTLTTEFLASCRAIIIFSQRRLVDVVDNLPEKFSVPAFIFTKFDIPVQPGNCTIIRSTKVSQFICNLSPNEKKRSHTSVVCRKRVHNFSVHLNKFISLCASQTDLYRQISLPRVPANSDNYSVFIEFRKMSHAEVLIRNCIWRMGRGWGHIVITGTENYSYYQTLCREIDPNIRVIQYPSDNLTHNEYNNLLQTTTFWESLPGEKLLIYQSDSFIFKPFDTEFLAWDFIGAPIHGDIALNGGLSLRTRQMMIDALNIDDQNEEFNPHINRYKMRKQLDKYPEDVVFSHKLAHGLGKLAPFEHAERFSSDLIWNDLSFGMHCMWNGNKNWHRNIIFKCG